MFRHSLDPSWSSSFLTLTSETLPSASVVGSWPGIGMAERVMKTDHDLGV